MKGFIFAGIFLVGSQCWSNGDCGTFDQILVQSQSVLVGFGDLNKPSCENKPDERIIGGVISCFQGGLQTFSAREQSEADLQLSGLYGAITQCYRTGIAQRAPGRLSFQSLVAATQADPTFETAWLTFSETVAGFKQEGFFGRRAVEIGLGISINAELKIAVSGLKSLPQTPSVVAELSKLKSLGRQMRTVYR
jgi:hypothetical protein